MNYIVFELQTNNGTTAVLSNSFDSLALAEQKFYQILSYAVVSDLDCHSALIVDENGFTLKTECFRHIKDVPVTPENPPVDAGEN